MVTFLICKLFLGMLLINRGQCIDVQKQLYLLDSNPPENGISDFILSKGYLPKDKDLPRSSIIRKVDNDVTYLLSKLSDNELVQLLNEKPNKNVYDLNDVVQIAFGHKKNVVSKVPVNRYQQLPEEQEQKYKNIPDPSGSDDHQTAIFKLDHKSISPDNQYNNANYLALNKLNDLLLARPREQLRDENLNDEKRQMLFDILVAQLRALCCKGTSKKLQQSPQISLADIRNVKINKDEQLKDQRLNEFMFLIVNDEIKNKSPDDDLILVDPDTLSKNSSVLLLGPITSPLTDGQLKVVMKRISNELSKPEYDSLLKQLSDGTVSDSNINLMKNFIFGPETRRYIKAHRCNHQSKLSKVYGGPKWLICTGYLNINTPSLYDK